MLIPILENLLRDESFLFIVIMFQWPIFLRYWLQEVVPKIIFKKWQHFAAYSCCIDSAKYQCEGIEWHSRKFENSIMCYFFPQVFHCKTNPEGAETTFCRKFPCKADKWTVQNLTQWKNLNNLIVVVYYNLYYRPFWNYHSDFMITCRKLKCWLGRMLSF